MINGFLSYKFKRSYKKGGFILNKKLKRISIVFLTALLFVVAFNFSTTKVKASASKIKVYHKRLSQNSIKISCSMPKKLTYWRIRQSVYNKKTGYSSYKTIKVLSKKNKSYTIKKLKKNTRYDFEITGGVKKKNKYKVTSFYEYIYSFFTGISNPQWDDYAASDANCSTTCIDLWGTNASDGMAIKGYQMYRREASEKKYKKIATFKKGSKYGFTYKDKKVKAGKTYYYKFRTYGVINKKTVYSQFSSVLKRYAVNKNGKFKTDLVSSSEDELIVKMTSCDKYNGDLVIGSDVLCVKGNVFKKSEQADEDIGVGVHITETSKDNITWSNLKRGNKFTLKGGQYIYLKLKANIDGIDLLNGTGLASEAIYYIGWPCILEMPFGIAKKTWPNAELIH